MTKKYDESTVKTLDALAHIRLRPGMYIGRLGDGSNPDDGIYVMLKEVIDNSVDEFIMKQGKKIIIQVNDATGCVYIRDFGRGIPLGKVIDCVSQINTGAKYNDDVFQFSVGLNGVGTKAVNALSSHFLVRSYREGGFVEAIFSQGLLKTEKKGKTEEPDGTYIEFIPDHEVFKKYRFQKEYILKRIWHYAYLNSGLVLEFNGDKIQSDHGLLDLLNAEVTEDKLYEPLHYRGKHWSLLFCILIAMVKVIFRLSMANIPPMEALILSAFREGILKGVNEFAKKNFQGVDVREGIVGTILVRLKDPVFESQTKNKLGNTEPRTPVVQEVKEAVVNLLHQYPETANRIIERIAFNEKLRRELAAVKKEAKEKQKKISFKIPKLRDSKYHYQDRICLSRSNR